MIYFIGDLHLDHANIIRYCHRPFSDVHEMNRALLNNWRKSIKNDDIVYFLGDLAFGRNSRSASYWVKHLTGRIVFIKGSHDRVSGESQAKLERGKYTFLMTHNPSNIQWTRKDNTWLIHGHKHNNNMSNYPFINGDNHTINVSVELTDYKPVSIDFLLSLDLNNVKRMDTIESHPVRW